MQKLTNFIRVFSFLIMTIGCVASYTSQAHLLTHWGMPAYLAWTIPFTVDFLAIMCSLVVHAGKFDAEVIAFARKVLFFALLVSCVANFLSGESMGARIAHVWCVVAYMLGELIVAKLSKRHGPAVDHAAEAAALREQLDRLQTAHAAQLAQLQAGHAAEITARDTAVDKLNRTHTRKLRAAERAIEKAVVEALAAADAVHAEQLAEAIAAPVHAAQAAPAPASSKLWTPDHTDPTEDVVSKVLAAASPLSPVSPAPMGA
jgi:hypothetical protein